MVVVHGHLHCQLPALPERRSPGAGTNLSWSSTHCRGRVREHHVEPARIERGDVALLEAHPVPRSAPRSAPASPQTGPPPPSLPPRCARAGAAVSTPVPHPRSTTRPPGAGRTSASRSWNGCSRSARKRAYCSGCQASLTSASLPARVLDAPPPPPQGGPAMVRWDERTALLVVDVQNDFADPNGGLSVAGGDAIIPALNAAIAAAEAGGACVLYTQDWHPPETPHFARDGGIWPVHCVRGHLGRRVPSRPSRRRRGRPQGNRRRGRLFRLHRSRPRQRKPQRYRPGVPAFATAASRPSSSPGSPPTTACATPPSTPPAGASPPSS